MISYTLTDQEQCWVGMVEPLIMEFAGGLDREEAEDWYFECAELLCDLAHNYCEECRRAGVAPIFESYHDQAMQTLLIKSCCMDQLAAAMDAFHCKEHSVK